MNQRKRDVHRTQMEREGICSSIRYVCVCVSGGRCERLLKAHWIVWTPFVLLQIQKRKEDVQDERRYHSCHRNQRSEDTSKPRRYVIICSNVCFVVSVLHKRFDDLILFSFLFSIDLSNRQVKRSNSSLTEEKRRRILTVPRWRRRRTVIS